MKYKVIFLPGANRDIASLADVLTPYPNRARRIFQEMERKLEQLKDNPFMWTTYHANPKYRRINLEDHALFYVVGEDSHEVRIYRVIYAKRDIPTLLDE
ncbi:MAG: type II toxin-antitoxin system RelE/ParE family toxin [Clostridiales Family XIII bacterium]|jgi:plasmid stabilization system protein ParE|nr:type II toxin-antitoxin system RelE/ParE family toxin [Clostridiales Family XIII bacterium]